MAKADEAKKHTFTDLLIVDAGYKATGREMIKLKNKLTKVTRPVPFCLVDDTGNWDYEVLVEMALLVAQKEKPEITREVIENGINVDNARDIAVELAFYFSKLSRDQVEKMFIPLDIDKTIEGLIDAQEAAPNPTTETPTETQPT